jgi:hypothetical protein
VIAVELNHDVVVAVTPPVIEVSQVSLFAFGPARPGVSVILGRRRLAGGYGHLMRGAPVNNLGGGTLVTEPYTVRKRKILGLHLIKR